MHTYTFIHKYVYVRCVCLCPCRMWTLPTAWYGSGAIEIATVTHRLLCLLFIKRSSVWNRFTYKICKVY